MPDVTCRMLLVGRHDNATESHVLQGRDPRSIRVLVPDCRGLDQNFHDVTIVDMGDLPESPARPASDRPSIRSQDLVLYRCGMSRHGFPGSQENMSISMKEASKRQPTCLPQGGVGSRYNVLQVVRQGPTLLPRRDRLCTSHRYCQHRDQG